MDPVLSGLIGVVVGAIIGAGGVYLAAQRNAAAVEHAARLNAEAAIRAAQIQAQATLEAAEITAHTAWQVAREAKQTAAVVAPDEAAALSEVPAPPESRFTYEELRDRHRGWLSERVAARAPLERARGSPIYGRVDELQQYTQEALEVAKAATAIIEEANRTGAH